MLQLLSDERLARRGAGGDEHAFEAIYRRYNQPLYRFCLAMTGDPQDAQEALQNTMLKVLRALPGERRRIKLKPWLYRIARNEAIEVIRGRRDNDELESELPCAGTVAETAETRERLRSLLSDLEQLPERQRAALLMRELSGCDYAEIGAAFGTSAAAARQTLYEARLGLRELEEGRDRCCADVRRELSDGDGRVLRRRRTRAHLRDCPDCRAFQEAIAERQRILAGIVPVPLAALAGVKGLLGGQAGALGTGGGGVAGTVGTGLGSTLATSAALKSVATVAVAVVAVSAADRTGVVDLHLRGGGEATAAHQASGSGGNRPADPLAADDGALGGGAPGGEAYATPSGKHRASGHAAPQQHAAGAPTGHGSSDPGLTPPADDRGGRSAEAGSAGDKGQETAASQKPGNTPGPPPSPGNQGQERKPEVAPPQGPPPQAGTPPVDPPAPPGPPPGKGPPAPAGDPPGPADKGTPPGEPPQPPQH